MPTTIKRFREYILHRTLLNLQTATVTGHLDDDDSDLLGTHSTQHGRRPTEEQVDVCGEENKQMASEQRKQKDYAFSRRRAF